MRLDLASLMRDVLSATPPSPAPEWHIHYRYMMAWANAMAARRPTARFLDFGCGEGQVVKAMRSTGMDVLGADVFYGGEDDRNKVAEEGLLGTAVHEIHDDKIPFAPETFDLILSNQVFEHVPQLNTSLTEVARVLKNDGLLVCLFPTKEVVREAHCGVPFLHWLPKTNPIRLSYATFLRKLGFTFGKDRTAPSQWAREALEWIDRYVFYRRQADVLRTFRRLFWILPIEEHYLMYRMMNHRVLAPLAPLLRVPWLRASGRLICHRFNGVVLLAQKRCNMAPCEH